MLVAYLILILLILLCIALPVGLFHLLALAFRSMPTAALALRWTGASLAVLVALGFVVGFSWGWRHIVVNRVYFKHSSIPASFDGYKIVQLSDFHIGTLSGHQDVVQHIVDSVNALAPDLIVFTGDLVNLKADEEREFHEILRGFKAKDGIVSVMGNHDYMMYAHGHRRVDGKGMKMSKSQVADIRRLQDAERDLGWHLLLNDHFVVTRGADSIVIVGVENDGDGKHFPQFGDLTKAQAGLSESTFKILLSHDPTHWRRRVLDETNIPLTLSGHTHAMQFTLFGWSPSQWIYPEWHGEYTIDNEPSSGASRLKSTHRTLFVSSGIGEVGVPFRLGAWPEIVMLTLRYQ